MRPMMRKSIGMIVGGTLLIATAAPAQAARFGDDWEEILVGAAVLAGAVAVIVNVLKDEIGDGRTRGDSADRTDERLRAIDACSKDAEAEAARHGRAPRVRDVDARRDGEDYRVDGEVEVARDTGWDGDPPEYDSVGFSCTVRDGRVTAFRLTGDFAYAARN